MLTTLNDTTIATTFQVGYPSEGENIIAPKKPLPIS
jgi:hypothetical protein